MGREEGGNETKAHRRRRAQVSGCQGLVSRAWTWPDEMLEHPRPKETGEPQDSVSEARTCPGLVESTDLRSGASGEQGGGEAMPQLGAQVSSDGDRELEGEGPAQAQFCK